jgi:3-oxoacyl-[acyl-carrier protein] reductase
MSSGSERPVALITGVGRTVSIGTAVAEALAADGWNIGFVHWDPYDDRMPYGREPDAIAAITARLHACGARVCDVAANLEDTAVPVRIFETVSATLGAPMALIMSHCESVDSGILDTSIESFDRHFAVNARASWLLIREFARHYRGAFGSGRIVALTSDHTVNNMPYGASKGALDRLTIAAAQELRHLGVTANVVNPGPVNTGWMPPELEAEIIAATPLGRLGQPSDCANLVRFLCSPAGQWVNGQLMHTNGGL